jgi:hypothetical protein
MEVSSCFCLCCYIPWEQKRKLLVPSGILTPKM